MAGMKKKKPTTKKPQQAQEYQRSTHTHCITAAWKVITRQLSYRFMLFDIMEHDQPGQYYKLNMFYLVIKQISNAHTNKQ